MAHSDTNPVLTLSGMRMWTPDKGLSANNVKISCHQADAGNEFNAIISDISTGSDAGSLPSIAVGNNNKPSVASFSTKNETVSKSQKRDLYVLPGFIDSHVHFLDGGRRKAGLNLEKCGSRAELIADIRRYIRKVLLKAPPSTEPITAGEALSLTRWKSDAEANTHAAVPWVMGYQWSDIKLGGLPNKEWLDEACPYVPILLVRFDCHSCVVNSCALELSGIDAYGPPNPIGGIVDRSPPIPSHKGESEHTARQSAKSLLGEPTGMLRESAMQIAIQCRRATWLVSDTDLADAYQAAANEFLSNGITSCFSMTSLDYDNIKEFDFLLNHNPHGNQIRMRSVVTVKQIDALTEIYDSFTNKEGKESSKEKVSVTGRSSAQSFHSFGSDYLKFGAVKIVSDGSLGSRTAAMLEPYGDVEAEELCNCPCGTLLKSSEDLHQDIATVAAKGLQCCTHAIGDRACQVIQDAYESCLNQRKKVDEVESNRGLLDIKSLRFRIEHCQHIASLDEIDRFKVTGTIPSVQPCHLLFDGDYMSKRLGSKRTNLSYNFRSMLDKGVHPVFGTDWMVAPICPISNILAAVHRQPITFEKDKADALPVWNPRERISVEEALRAYTSDAAHGLFMEDCIGRIEVGYFADFVILDGNPLELLQCNTASQTSDEDQPLTGLRVVATIVGGKVRYIAPAYEDLVQSYA